MANSRISDELSPTQVLENKPATAIEHVEEVDAKLQGWDQVRADAIVAEEAEHALGFRDSIKLYPRAIFWSMALSLCIVMEGYDTALLGSILGLESYRKKFGFWSGEEHGYQLEPQWQIAVSQAPLIGNFFGIFVASWAQDKWGYRRTIQINLVLMAIFIFPVFFAPSIQVLFVGEMLCGLPWGAFSSSAVSYASEVTPVSLRGYLTTYVNLCWIIGQFLCAGVLVGVSHRTDQWSYKIPWAVQWVWPVPLFLLATFAPESPWFLVRKGKLAEAERCVARLQSKDPRVDPGNTVAMMVRTNQLEIDNKVGGSYWDCFKGVDLRRTEIACVAWAAQQLAGSSFAGSPVYFFQQAGLPSDKAFQLTLGCAGVGFVGTCMSWVTLTYCGRRPVYLVGLSLMALWMFIIGGVAFSAEAGNGTAKWIQAAFFMVAVFTYDFTIGPMAYCVVGEISSTRLRGKTVGLARNVYNVTGLVCSILATYQLNPTAWNWKGKGGLFWGVSAFLVLVWAYFRLPEARGRTYRELDILFERRISARKFKQEVVNEEDDA